MTPDPSSAAGAAQMPEAARMHGAARMPGKVAAAVLGLQALAAVGFAVFSMAELATGAEESAANVVMLSATVLVFGVGLAAIARALVRGVHWARTGTVVWDALLLPVAWSLVQSGQGALGGLVGVLAIVPIVGVVMDSTPS